jgi:hypothetical protein
MPILGQKLLGEPNKFQFIFYRYRASDLFPIEINHELSADKQEALCANGDLKFLPTHNTEELTKSNKRRVHRYRTQINKDSSEGTAVLFLSAYLH